MDRLVYLVFAILALAALPFVAVFESVATRFKNWPFTDDHLSWTYVCAMAAYGWFVLAIWPRLTK